MLIVAAITAQILADLWHSNDPDALESREFLKTNSQLSLMIENVEHIDFRRKLTYNGTPDDPAYIEFTYAVSGTNSKVMLVRIRKYENKESYEVHELQNL